MENVLPYLLACLFCLVACENKFTSEVGVDDQVDTFFNVKPGGQTLTEEISWEGVTCKFTYVAQGGTNEQWLIGINYGGAPHTLSCIVMRPPGGTLSYLFFQKFSLEITGAKLVKGEVYGKNENLIQGEYKEDLEKNLVSEVPEKFQNAMTRIVAYFTLHKEEL